MQFTVELRNDKQFDEGFGLGADSCKFNLGLAGVKDRKEWRRLCGLVPHNIWWKIWKEWNSHCFEGNDRPLSNLLSFSYSAFPLASWGVPRVFCKFHGLLGDCDL